MLPFLASFISLFRSVRALINVPEFRALVVMVGALLLAGMVFYHQVEGWAWLDALYFSLITLATVGYGDFAPRTPTGKVFTMIYIIIGISLLAAFVRLLGDDLLKRRMARGQRRDAADQDSDG